MYPMYVVVALYAPILSGCVRDCLCWFLPSQTTQDPPGRGHYHTTDHKINQASANSVDSGHNGEITAEAPLILILVTCVQYTAP